jgi:hypothetical protein
MKKLLIALCVLTVCVIASVAISVTITKGLIGKQDMSLWDGTSTKTFTRTNEDSQTLTLNKFDWVGVDVLQKFGGGVSYTDTTITSALGTVGAVNDVALWIAPGTWTIADDLTITANVTLVVPPGAVFSIASGKTLTINGSLKTGLHQIFSGSGLVRGQMKIDAAYSEWWGAVPDGSTDSYAAITAAIAHINALGTGAFYPLQLSSGIYAISDTLQIDLDFFHLRGMGRGRAVGSTTAVKGPTSILYTGAALTGTEAVLNLGQSGNNGVGIRVSDLSIICQDNGIGITTYGMYLAELRNIYIDQPTTGIYATDTTYSTLFENIEIYDASTGGIDLRQSVHSTDIINCAFNGDSVGSNTPTFGLRLGGDGNSSEVNVMGCNFDQYKVTDHVRIVSTDLKGFNFIGNYIEGRDDSTTAGLIDLDYGDGVNISGNRITDSGSVNYGIELGANVDGVSITANYFSGMDISAILMSSGAANVFIAGNDRNGLTLLTNQNSAGSKNVVVVDEGELKAETLQLEVDSELTLDTNGAITITGSFHTVDTYEDAATDNLDTISGSTTNQFLILQTADNARDITVRDSQDNIELSGNCTLDNIQDKLVLFWEASAWHELVCQDNGA